MNIRPNRVKDKLARFGSLEEIGEASFFETVESAVEEYIEANGVGWAEDLPLSCPMPGMYLWNSHPKVFLPIEETGEAQCPYCGAQYFLGEEED